VIQAQSHPLLEARAFFCDFPQALREQPAWERVRRLLTREEEAPLRGDEDTRQKVRQMLRWGGFKPTGRSKPASEYLKKAFQEGFLSSINAAVDAGNAVSLWSGLPISVLDVDRLTAPYRLEVVTEKQSYVFNPSGQELDLQGLVCFGDAQGPCGSAVKDSQRSKTHEDTRRTLCLIWGCRELGDYTQRVEDFYRQLLLEGPVKLQACPLQ